MKKLLLLGALAAGVMAANAQNISVTTHGTPIENGSTVDSYCLVVDKQVAPWGEEFISYQLDPELVLNCEPASEVTITVSNITTNINEQWRYDYMHNPEYGYVNMGDFENLAPDPYTIAFCWPIQCQNVTPGLTLSETAMSSDQPKMGIDSFWIDELPEEGLTLSCNVKVVPVANPGNVFSFTLNMRSDENAVEGIEADNDATPVYYNLNGVRVANPDHGIYIVKKGGKTSKVIL